MDSDAVPRRPWEDPRAFGVYLHFPFCPSRCTYCDFVVTTSPKIPSRAYAEAVLSELARRAERFDGLRMVSIYFGGGTPSLWAPEQVGRVVEALVARFGDRHLQEITLEANPEDGLASRIPTHVGAGINRLSVGVQALDDRLLLGLSRRHSAREALAAVRAALACPGLRSVSADLIYGLPGSTVDQVRSTAETLLSLGLPHLSLYALSLSPRTPMAHQIRRGRVLLPDDDAVADQAERLFEILGAHGLRLYEVSNAARPGHEAVHNSLYWHMRPYLGLGVGAAGLEPAHPGWEGDPLGLLRRENVRSVDRYLAAPERPRSEEPVSAASWRADLLLLRTRWLAGADLLAEIEPYARQPELQRLQAALERLRDQGLLTGPEGAPRLTPRGVMLCAAVVLELLDALEGKEGPPLANPC